MLEKELFQSKHQAYYLGLANVIHGLDSDFSVLPENRDEYIRRLGELARIMTDSGKIFITTISDIDDYDVERLRALNRPSEILVINAGVNDFSRFKPDLCIENYDDADAAVHEICKLLKKHDIIDLEYHI